MAFEAGYAGKIVFLDLSDGTMVFYSTQKYADQILSGRDMAAKIFRDRVPTHIHPFDAENHLVFITGPLSGFTDTDTQWIVCGRSANESVRGVSCDTMRGNWGKGLSLTGFDGIVIHGKSKRPVYLLIQGDIVEIMDATLFWGKGAKEVTKILRSELGKSVEVVTMGIDGEQLAPSSSIHVGRYQSESGFGAAMGAKKLKAIVVTDNTHNKRRIKCRS